MSTTTDTEAPAFASARQWRAQTMQLVNWGGFHGHTSVDFAAAATLLSGASGTGKSTLLDAYLALMMPSDTPFNGASNDAVAGRARGVDQRSVLSYLRGKTDDSRETGTGALRDQVLRGADGSTWGAVAMTFVNDTGARFTALRVYLAPRSATQYSDVTAKMATFDGYLNLTLLEPLAAGKFDKRALIAAVPELQVHDTYTRFSQVLHTRLGIGANGDGTKALRLLARIQAGHQIRTVDDLYKSMVLELPATYAAADRAVEHFADLEASYDAMLTEGEKARVLERIPSLYTQFVAAQEAAALIDTFGLQRTGDSPFVKWTLTHEHVLLDVAEENNRTGRARSRAVARTHSDEELRLKGLLRDIQDRQDAEGGGAIKRLDEDIARLSEVRDEAERRREVFDRAVRVLDLLVTDEAELTAAQHTARDFLATFTTQLEQLTLAQSALQADTYPLMNEKRELTEEHTSLQGRDGLVPKDLHEARLAVATASGIHSDHLSFVAELVDIAPGQERWRTAAELTFASIASVMLVEESQLSAMSRAIDSLALRTRLNFDGVPAVPHQEVVGDPTKLSGKLVYKPSPFAHWVQERLRSPGVDALCVENAAELDGPGRRVTPSGQIRSTKSGAHGRNPNARNILGFSNTARLADIDSRLKEIELALTDFDVRVRDLSGKVSYLHTARAAHQFVLDSTFKSIDPDGPATQIRALTEQRQRIVASSDLLRTLEAEEGAVTADLTDASRKKYAAEAELAKHEVEHVALVDRKDQVSNHLDAMQRAQEVTLTAEQSEHLSAEFTKVADPGDLATFHDGVGRLRKLLLDRSAAERQKVQDLAESLTSIFESFDGKWHDPNRGTGIASYDMYRTILDTIRATGLHERRAEWTRRLADWSGEDLVPLSGAFESSIQEIVDRLDPINKILEQLAFGAHRDRLKIDLRRLHKDDIVKFQRELRHLASGITTGQPDGAVEERFKRLRRFIALLRPGEGAARPAGVSRDYYLDVRKHVEITAIALDKEGRERSTFAALGGKSGGETQELVAFIVGAALRFQLGDQANTRPCFAPVFLDEGFVKSDSEFAGRAVSAWKGLGFQLIIGAPLDKVTALEPLVDEVLTVTKSPNGYSHVRQLVSPPGAAT